MTFHEEFYVCYPSFARVFGIDMVEGEAAALEEKGRVLIPASMAHRFFGDHPAVGQVLIGEGWMSEVGGVYPLVAGRLGISPLSLRHWC